MIMSINQRLSDLGFRVVARTSTENLAISDIKSLPKSITISIPGKRVKFKQVDSQLEADRAHPYAHYEAETKLCEAEDCSFNIMIEPYRSGKTRVSVHALDHEIDEDERIEYKMVSSDAKLSDVLKSVIPGLLTKRVKNYLDGNNEPEDD